MKYIRQSRLKLIFYAAHLFLLEGILKLLFPQFPLTELFTAQVGVIGGYITVKTINNSQYEANNERRMGLD